MKAHLSGKSCFAVFVSMAVLGLAAGTVNSATTAVTYQVSATADDGYAWSAAEQDIGSGYLVVGDDRTYTAPFYMSAMRFTNVDAPRNAHIVDARLKISSISEEFRGQIYGLIQAEATDDAADFTARYIGAISKTTAAADWDHKDAWSANTYYTSPDISGLIQEVIGRTGWNSGNAMAICYSTRADSGKSRMFGSFEAGAGFAAVLEITYETYSISGYIKTSDNTPVEGVTVSAGADIESTETNASGYYELKIPPGWSGMVTPSKTDWGFTPASKTYSSIAGDQTNQDFTAFQPVISGYVKDESGTGISGVSIQADNGGGYTITDVNGYYSIIVAYSWSGSVTALKEGYSITPQNISFNNVINDQSEQNFIAFQPTISGIITAYGGPLAGVTLTGNNNGGVTTTDANGIYHITVPYGWSGSITPSKPQYTFTPAQTTYNNVTADTNLQNYTAILPPVIISGYVNDNSNSPVSDVNIVATDLPETKTDSSGYYQITVPYNWTGTVTATKTGYLITPDSIDFTNIHSGQTNQNFSAFQPTISGFVRDANNNPVAAVNISTDNGGGSDITGSDGYYEIVVPYDWSGTVTTYRLGWGFTPSNRSYNNVVTEQFNQDFLAVYVGIIVKPDGTGDFATIQAAIDAASDGDVITLEAGTYTGGGNRDVTFRGKAITVKGATGDPNDCIINCQGTSSNRHLGFKFIDGELANSVLKNVTITNGSGIKEYTSWPSYWIIGGGIYCNVGSPTIDNCIIRNNRVGFNGGGIYSKNGNLTISNCIFIDNTAHAGGGICSSDGNLVISNCTFTSNHAIGGGIAISSSNSSTISNCIINENSSDDKGGGISCSTSNININNCIISNNSSKGDGAGIHFRESNPTLNNCVINNNRAYDPEIYSQTGGGILASKCILFINNCTICGNSSEQNGGGISNFDSSIFISNSILRDNFPFHLPLSGYSINYCNIQGGYAGTGNIDVDPSFKSDGYHLTNSSPCIDAGDPNYACEPNTTDIDGDPRIAVKVDMGADEISSLSALILLSPDSLNFQSEGLTSGLQSQDILIKNYGAEILNWQSEISGDCNWLTASQMSGQLATGDDCEIQITVDPSGTGYGLHSCQLQVIDPGAENSPQVVTVNLEVLGPVLTVSPVQFYFETFLAEPNTTGQILSVQNTGYDTLNWDVNIPVGCNWLNASEISGQSAGELDEVVLSIDHNNVERGFHQCDVLISAPDAESSPQAISVELMVLGMKGQRHVPAEYPTIQAAVDAAVDGDEVIIEPGIYTGPGNYNIYFWGKAITVRSVDPNNPAIVAATIIEPNIVAGGFRFYQYYYEDRADSIIDGLTIRLCIDRPAIHCSGGSPTIRNCIIEDNYHYNSPYYGVAGIECYDSNAVISNCVIRNNYGSGLRSLNSDLTVRNCTFTGNRGSYNNYYVFETSFGGGISLEGGDISIINCTFSGNVADVGGAICSFGSYAYITNVIISNCIFWENDANDGHQIALMNYHKEISPTVSVSVSVSYSDIQGGEAAVYVDPCCTLEWDNNNLDIDPCFAEPGYWELNGTPEDANDDFWVYGDYHLNSQKGRWKSSIYIGLDSNDDGFINQVDFAAFANSWQKQGVAIPADLDYSGIVDLYDLRLLLYNYLSSYTPGQWVLDNVTSPCIDAGDPNSNWTAELWPHGRRINMGAYGGTPEGSMSLSNAGNIADLNGDDSVGYADFVLFMGKWLYEAVLLPEDLGRDGFVNFSDVAIFANNWQGTPAQASSPNPADGARGVDPNADLGWTAGYGTTSHDVYFGASSPPPFIGNQAPATFDPGTMTGNTTYFWRINEVNSGGSTKGTVWSFTTYGPPPLGPLPPPGTLSKL